MRSDIRISSECIILDNVTHTFALHMYWLRFMSLSSVHVYRENKLLIIKKKKVHYMIEKSTSLMDVPDVTPSQLKEQLNKLNTKSDSLSCRHQTSSKSNSHPCAQYVINITTSTFYNNYDLFITPSMDQVTTPIAPFFNISPPLPPPSSLLPSPLTQISF